MIFKDGEYTNEELHALASMTVKEQITEVAVHLYTVQQDELSKKQIFEMLSSAWDEYEAYMLDCYEGQEL